jgi:septum formation protein
VGDPVVELPTGTTLVLASASPRRLDLLRSVGLDPEVRPADLDESVIEGEEPAEYVVRLAEAKAAAVVRSDDDVIIAADTSVVIDDAILGKPADAVEARAMLRALSGRVHRVVSGVVVRPGVDDPDRHRSTVVVTEVEFLVLEPALVDWYVATGEPFDKAGGYALQGAGGVLVRRLDGSASNVIGLPLAETLDLLRRIIAGAVRG